MKKQIKGRREFLTNTTKVMGGVLAGGLTIHNMAAATFPDNRREDETVIPRRRAKIATISQAGLRDDAGEKMVERVLGIMEHVAKFKPDIICLPETFATNGRGSKDALSWKAEITALAVGRMSEFAKKHHCYVVCSGHRLHNGKYYITAELIDRNGISVGDYKKSYLPEDEMNAGITPGPLENPVFDTDFGRIGFQICFDLLWDNGWNELKDQGVEIVFWPSAYSGGRAINGKAWSHQYIVVTSTGKGSSKICDISGEELIKTNGWEPNIAIADINLNKTLIHTWPSILKFNKIRDKYLDKIKITTFDEEEWSIVESLSPKISVDSILEEFQLESLFNYRKRMATIQHK